MGLKEPFIIQIANPSMQLQGTMYCTESEVYEQLEGIKLNGFFKVYKSIGTAEPLRTAELIISKENPNFKAEWINTERKLILAEFRDMYNKRIEQAVSTLRGEIREYKISNRRENKEQKIVLEDDYCVTQQTKIVNKLKPGDRQHYLKIVEDISKGIGGPGGLEKEKALEWLNNILSEFLGTKERRCL